MRSATSDTSAWRIALLLSIASAGLAIGDERPREASQYFWDLSSYVTALDADNPYQSDAIFAFLYPPVAADIFKLARSHLFELMSMAYVGALVAFLLAYSRLNMPRRFEWLAAITAMGGLGVVSLKTGNVAIVMNFTLLALLVHAAMGSVRSRLLLPVAIVGGALIKPQFLLYLGLLPVIERPLKAAIVKLLAAAAAVVAVYGAYVLLRPEQWRDYVAGVNHRLLTEQDFGWGPAALLMHISGSNTAALAGYAVTLLAVAVLSYVAWRKSRAETPLISVACLGFVVLTFANPRVPLYDLYAAAIALAICCGKAGGAQHAWVMTLALAVNLVPWMIEEFARTPSAWPWWMRDYLIGHMAGVALLLLSLSRSGLANASRPRPS